MRARKSQKKPRPLVSVVIPCHNYGRFLGEAVRSVIRQTERRFEILVVDDASKDGSAEIAGELAKKHPEHVMRVIRNSRNRGLAETRNIGIRASKGRYILPLDADDVLKPRCLEEMVRTVETAPADIVYTKVRFFGTRKGIMDSGPFRFDVFRRKNILSAMSLFKKRDWKRAGGYRTLPVTGWEDYDFWIRLVRNGARAVFIPKVLCRYRKHEKSMLKTITEKRMDLAQRGIYREHGDWCVELPRYVEIAGIYRSCGLLEQAARFYGKALSIDPRHYTALYNLASVYEERGDFGKARALFLEARRNAYGYSDDVSGVDFHLGRIAFAQGEHKRARKHLRSALRENPVHRGANAMLEGLQ